MWMGSQVQIVLSISWFPSTWWFLANVYLDTRSFTSSAEQFHSSLHFLSQTQKIPDWPTSTPHLPDWTLNTRLPPYYPHQRPTRTTPRYSSTYARTYNTLLSSRPSYISTDRIRIWRWKWIARKKTKKCVRNKLKKLKKLYPVRSRFHSFVSTSFHFQKKHHQK